MYGAGRVYHALGILEQTLIHACRDVGARDRRNKDRMKEASAVLYGRQYRATFPSSMVFSAGGGKCLYCPTYMNFIRTRLDGASYIA
jgi:hypothetical protein